MGVKYSEPKPEIGVRELYKVPSLHPEHPYPPEPMDPESEPQPVKVTEEEGIDGDTLELLLKEDIGESDLETITAGCPCVGFEEGLDTVCCDVVGVGC